MRGIEINHFVCNRKSIPLGIQGENAVRYIYYNAKELIRDFGEGTFSFFHQPYEKEPYLMMNTWREGYNCCVTLTDVDTAIAGNGKIQFVFEPYELDKNLDDNIRTIILNSYIEPSLGIPVDAPDPWDSILEHVKLDADRAEEAALSILNVYPVSYGVELTLTEEQKALARNNIGAATGLGTVIWGGITGDINDQLDLKEKLVWEPGSGEDSVQTVGTGASAIGDKSVAEGLNTVANSNYSHAEGYASKTVIDLDDTEGQGQASHAEGTGTTAKGTSSHAEGGGTLAIGRDSHAEGNSTTTGGNASHAEGNWTITNNLAEHAEGTFNKSNMASSTFGDAGNTIHSVGIGSAGELEDNRKNALEIMQNGDAYLYGVGNYDGTNIDEAETLLSVLNNSLLTPEDTNNKVTSISSASTDDLYPSAKAVYDAIEAAVARILENR